MTDFTPPATAPWATYQPHRYPSFKVHATIGLARQARTYHGKQTTRLFEWVDGKGWVER